MGRIVVASGVGLLVASASATSSVAAVDIGFGKAQAQLLMLDPRSAQLSFGVRFGPTAADHRNRVARAQAQSTDYGLIGGAVTADSCETGEKAAISTDDLPKAMRADSREPSDRGEQTVTEGPITQSVRADDRPFARATSRLAEADLPGIVSLRGAANTTSSGLGDDGAPEVRATVDIAALSLVGGIVTLGPLHWEAVHRGDGQPRGSFTIGNASIGGTPIPTQDASATISAINNVLSQLGIVLVPPVTHVETDTLFVDPIKIGVAPNATRDLVAGEVLAALQPAREALFQALIDASCNSGAAITVADILLGSVTGGGSFTAVIGGAQAQFVEAVPGFQIGGTGTGGATTGPGFDPGGGLPSGSGTFTPPSGAPVTVPRAVTGADPVPLATTRTRAASDRAVAVSLAALLLGGLFVESDRRKMRQAGVVAAPPVPVPTEATPE